MEPEDMTKENSTGYVIVGCKLPHGLIISARNSSGDVVSVTLKGANAARIIGGYGITEAVPKDLWDAWLKKNHKHAAVLNGSVFIHDDAKSAESIAKERRDVPSGFESIDPLKNGMLKGADGQVDEEAAKTYRQQMGENPDRNRQIRE
jgi:hypothetical protein